MEHQGQIHPASTGPRNQDDGVGGGQRATRSALDPQLGHCTMSRVLGIRPGGVQGERGSQSRPGAKELCKTQVPGPVPKITVTRGGGGPISVF